MLILGLEEAMVGRIAGEEFSVTVPPEKGYGVWNEDLVNEVPMSDLEGITNLQVGLQLQAHTPYGIQVFTVKEIKEEGAIMDGNHPLAGQSLHFAVKINEVRDATEEEINPAHSCGCGTGGGHGHDHEHEKAHGGCGGGGSCGC
jgi:FKBP-type peptidyl-prolyl cis-trans isomerase SlyD